MIHSAAASGTTNPVVHLEAGNYSVNTTLVVPAGEAMQIIGDGGRTQLTWTGSGTGPVMRLQGPSKATLSNFSVSGNNQSANGIEVDDVDQAKSSVFMEEAWLARFPNWSLRGRPRQHERPVARLLSPEQLINRRNKPCRDWGAGRGGGALAGWRDKHICQRRLML